MTTASDRPKGTSPRSISGLLPFLRPYRLQIGLALLFLVMAAVSTLAFPLALRSLIDGGLVTTDKGAQVMALRDHFFALFGVAVALGVFTVLHGELVGRARHGGHSQRCVFARFTSKSAIL
jgi:ATP-binding cassette, subfamily B, bacterial